MPDFYAVLGLWFPCRFYTWMVDLKMQEIPTWIQPVFHLFDPQFASQELQFFSGNVAFWSYCSVTQELIKISPATFPDMKVWEVISACLSIKSIHGEYVYRGHKFSDPMFCPAFRKLIRTLLRDGGNHLFLN